MELYHYRLSAGSCACASLKPRGIFDLGIPRFSTRTRSIDSQLVELHATPTTFSAERAPNCSPADTMLLLERARERFRPSLAELSIVECLLHS